MAGETQLRIPFLTLIKIGAVLSLPIAAADPIVERIWLRERLPPDTVGLHEHLDETQT